MTNKKGEKSGDPTQAAATLTREDVLAMIEAALQKHPSIEELHEFVGTELTKVSEANEAAYKDFVSKMPDTILGVVKDTQLFNDRISDEVASAVAGLDLSDDIISALDMREARLAEQLAADEQAAKDAATAAQRKAQQDQKKAAKAVEDANLAAEKKRMAAVDRAHREYATIVADPIATALGIEAAKSIELRLADGKSFMPGFEFGGIKPQQLTLEGGRAVLDVSLAVAPDAIGFTASEAILIVEGGDAGDPLAVWRAELVPPMRVGGGGALAEFPAGTFAFRRLSPVPEAATA